MLVESCCDESGGATPPPPSHEASYALGEEIASFAARVDVAMHAMLTRLRRFDAMNGWGPGGFVSCAQWLAWRTHIEANTAREHVRVARALGELPIVDAHFARGELSYSKVRAITRVATPESEQAFVDIASVARAYLQHRPRTLGSAYELVVVTTEDQLNAGPGGVGGFLRDGTPIPLHIARMLAHNGSRVDVVLGEHGELLDVGRRTRAIPAAIARGLWLRDGGCRVPGCGRSRHLHAHHVHGWADGGPTKLGNLVLVCSTHHRMIHEGALAVNLQPGEKPGCGRVVFVDQRDRVISRFPATAANLDELEHWLREADVHIDPALTVPKWDGRPMDLQDSLTWMLMSPDPRLRGGAVHSTV